VEFKLEVIVVLSGPSADS